SKIDSEQCEALRIARNRSSYSLLFPLSRTSSLAGLPDQSGLLAEAHSVRSQSPGLIRSPLAASISNSPKRSGNRAIATHLPLAHNQRVASMRASRTPG